MGKANIDEMKQYVSGVLRRIQGEVMEERQGWGWGDEGAVLCHWREESQMAGCQINLSL